MAEISIFARSRRPRLEVTGPLDGASVVELGGIGPSTFACMILADLGAHIIRIDRAFDANAESVTKRRDWLVRRSRESIAVDLQNLGGVEVVLRLCEKADVIVDPFRPGVAERLGVGPEECTARNPRVVFCRTTGWGQEGPYATMPGHDINYLAVSGLLHAIGPRGGPPVPPLNLLADYAGGALYSVIGILAGVIEARKTGEGQVIDAAMVDGVVGLTTLFHGMRAGGAWSEERGTNLVDGGAPFYGVYETADGEYIALGAIEPPFFAALLALLGLQTRFADQHDRSDWPRMREEFAQAIQTRTRSEWASAVLGDPLQCVTPVLSFSESTSDPHLTARGSFMRFSGADVPAPAPRLARTPGPGTTPPPEPGQHTRQILLAVGYNSHEIAELERKGAVVQGASS
jgi:alpha-methylacyl-CoA racemase